MELKINELLELIREQVELFEDVGAPPPKTAQLELDDWIPKIQITGEWGQPNNKSREQIDKFVSRAPEGKVNLELSNPTGIFERKLQGLVDLVKGSEKTSEAGLGSTFATIVLLDIMHAIIAGIAEAADERAGGFIFEPFCAALAGGIQQGGTDQLVDFISSDGINYSLKLIKGGKAEGSISNLYADFGVGNKVENPNLDNFKKNHFIRYIVFNKRGQAKGIEIFVFDMDNESIPVLFNQKQSISNILITDPQQKHPRLFTDDGQKFKPDVTFEDIIKAKPFQGKPRFDFSRNQVINAKNVMPGKVAIIAQLPNIDEIKDSARRAAEQFKDLLIPAYKSMKDLTDNLNTYFLGVGGDEAARMDSSAASIEAERIVTDELPKNIRKAVVRRDTSSPVRSALKE